MKIYEMCAHEIADLIDKREISCVDVAKAQIERIEEVEPLVDSMVTLLPEYALERAEEIDKKITAGEKPGVLAGVPVAVKDNICTEGIKTTCASKMLYNFVPPYSATVFEKLTDAGCVTVGKANMDEFAMGSSTENSYFKKTKNPYDLTRIPGGSSGGSAAAVAADLAAFALGSDTGGSIRQPAALCGVVGLKPTYGLVSRFGLVAFASSLDQIGTFTKDVTDCALALNVIAGHDPKDSTSLPAGYADYTKALVADVKGMKIGIPDEYMSDAIDPEVKAAVLRAAKEYEAMGATVDRCSLPMMPYALSAYYLISSAEASSNLARYDGIRYGFRAEGCTSLDEVFLKTRSQGFGDEVKRRIMLGTFVLSSGYYDAYYKKAQQVRTLIKKDFDRVFNDFDLLISPTSPTTAWKIGEKTSDPLKMYAADICTISINIAGLPGLVVPCGLDSQGLPIGMQLIGKPLGESTLLQAAYTLEQSRVFTNPKPTLGGSAK